MKSDFSSIKVEVRVHRNNEAKHEKNSTFYLSNAQQLFLLTINNVRNVLERRSTEIGNQLFFEK